MEALEFSVHILEKKKEELEKSIIWLIGKIKKEEGSPDHWSKMIAIRWKKRRSLQEAIKILKDDWKYQRTQENI